MEYLRSIVILWIMFTDYIYGTNVTTLFDDDTTVEADVNRHGATHTRPITNGTYPFNSNIMDISTEQVTQYEDRETMQKISHTSMRTIKETTEGLISGFTTDPPNNNGTYSSKFINSMQTLDDENFVEEGTTTTMRENISISLEDSNLDDDRSMEGLPTQCEPTIMNSCKVTQMERCISDNQRATCRCLHGYSRDQHGNCIAIYRYRGQLKTLVSFDKNMAVENSAMYKTFTSQAKKALTTAMTRGQMSERIMEIHIVSLNKTKNNTVYLEFDIILSRQHKLSMDFIQTELSNGLAVDLQPSGLEGIFQISNTQILLDIKSLGNFHINVLDPCSDPLMNFCHERASCSSTASGGFVCVCSHGYDDISIDQENASGESCEYKCGCKNGGQCMSELDEVVCICPSWYFGSECGLNGKLLFAVLCVIFGIFIVVALVVCCVCYKKMGYRVNKEKVGLDAAVHRDFPNADMYKKTKSWLEEWRQTSVRPDSDTYNDICNDMCNDCSTEQRHFQSRRNVNKDDLTEVIPSLSKPIGLSIPRPQIKNATDTQDR